MRFQVDEDPGNLGLYWVTDMDTGITYWFMENRKYMHRAGTGFKFPIRVTDEIRFAFYQALAASGIK